MSAIVAAGAGFLLAVLWFDLMFDIQVLRHRGGGSVLPGTVLDSISAYYRRVTTDAQPMGRLIVVVMAVTLTAIAAQIAAGDSPAWVAWSALALTASAFLIAGLHTVPAAVRLGQRRDPAEHQSALARSICRDHLYCLAAIAAVLALELGWGG